MIWLICFNAKFDIVYRASRPRVGSTESRPGGERQRERERDLYLYNNFYGNGV